MRRLDRVPTTTSCPHFQRPISATRNQAIAWGGRLVDCAEKAACRDPSPEAAGHEHARRLPHGCPVLPSRSR
jgi:hypothetical protein